MSAPAHQLRPGERVLLVDDRGRRFLLRLQPGLSFHFHGGVVPHDLLLASQEGAIVRSSLGTALLLLRPRLADVVVKMPRGAQVIYPKDIGAILVQADIAPGVRVLEAGSGSGALSLALARAVGHDGRLVSYEIRPDFHQKALDNVEAFFGDVPPTVELRHGDVRDVAGTGEAYDRVVLDLPEPWGVLDAVGEVLRPGGLVCTYLPTTNQTQASVLALEGGGFTQVETFEALFRTWHVTERSVRPDHRMVAHTGFITVARRGERHIRPKD